MRLSSSRSCPRRTPEQRRRDDMLVLGSALFTVLLSLLTVLLS
jgi:hypothetical protein